MDFRSSSIHTQSLIGEDISSELFFCTSSATFYRRLQVQRQAESRAGDPDKSYFRGSLPRSRSVSHHATQRNGVSSGVRLHVASYADALWACHEFLPHEQTACDWSASVNGSECSFLADVGGGIRDKPKERLRRRPENTLVGSLLARLRDEPKERRPRAIFVPEEIATGIFTGNSQRASVNKNFHKTHRKV